MHIYISNGLALSKRSVKVCIGSRALSASLNDQPFFLTEPLASMVDVDESTWLLEDGSVHIILRKARIGEVWPSVFVGGESLSVAEQDEVKKSLLRERFSLENPDMDFSGAAFTGGDIPDPRTFMGGIRHS